MQLIARSRWIDYLFLTILFSILYFTLIGARPLFVPDEGRYAEIAREMVVSGDYVTPYLNGIKYFEKPILFYWLEAGMIKLFGLKIISVRGVNAFLGLFGCLFTYFFASQLYNRRSGLIAASILGTSLLYLVMSQMVSLDLPVTVFLTVSLGSFALSVFTPQTKKYFWISAAFAGLAVLTKGLIGIVFPGLIIGFWLIMSKRWQLLRQLPILSGLLIFLMIVLPWHLLVTYRNPDFFYFYFFEQHFLRYTTKTIGHYQPIGFFLPYLVLGLFPWIIFLPQTIKHLLTSNQDWQKNVFFMVWWASIFVFFSFSKSKLIPYILPTFPPLAILLARYFDEVLLVRPLSLGSKISYLLILLLSAGIFFLLLKMPNQELIPDPNLAKRYLSFAAIILLCGGVGTFIFKSTQKKMLLLFVTNTVFVFVLMATLPFIDNRSIYPLAQQLKPALRPQDEVISMNHYYQDLPFYLERKVSILNWRNELSHGMQYQLTDWMLTDEDFWLRWHSKRRIFAFIDADKLVSLQSQYPAEKISVLARHLKTYIITNQPIAS